MIPYVWPLVDGFASPHFLDTARAKRKELLATLGRTFGDRLSVNEHWARISGDLKVEPNTWLPKVYLCVGRRSFWPVVSALAQSPDLVGVCNGFKIFAGRTELKAFRQSYRRPDKIVFYAPQPALGRLMHRLNDFVRGRQCHGIRHTGRPEEYGLPGAKGLYVGIDPLFLGALSWRIYRAVAIHWLSLNRAFVQEEWGSIDHWLERMNLDLRSEGPRSLRPSKRDRAFIRANWAEMFAEGVSL
ncbi:hypothetical protein [Hyalangium versicolor]|uniref:hypothetical protein n=1 Tax=Hyalangium versicolor TaxID=2861190 RepID=UPI001CCD7E67|nr:hypothetical protein [Hyalangium versicolor]